MVLTMVNNKFVKLKNSNGTLNCSICMDSNTNIHFIKTSCGHYYHEECINQWIIVKNNCPNCREVIK